MGFGRSASSAPPTEPLLGRTTAGPPALPNKSTHGECRASSKTTGGSSEHNAPGEFTSGAGSGQDTPAMGRAGVAAAGSGNIAASSRTAGSKTSPSGHCLPSRTKGRDPPPPPPPPGVCTADLGVLTWAVSLIASTNLPTSRPAASSKKDSQEEARLIAPLLGTFASPRTSRCAKAGPSEDDRLAALLATRLHGAAWESRGSLLNEVSVELRGKKRASKSFSTFCSSSIKLNALA
mmetsp:Transcript_161034/g.516874  ORF Transcript_161034/g.516874 Transcript_161034/m.516874 type:complete len:235 (-) Transcript_161034:4202-4906(-)